MVETSYEFTRAITRAPCTNIIAGLRAVDVGTPDLDLMRSHHADYIAMLKETGATVIELEALEDYPDSVFVEDTALCLPKGAVLMRPGAPSRLGEVEHMAAHLRAQYDEVLEITSVERKVRLLSKELDKALTVVKMLSRSRLIISRLQTQISKRA